MSVLRLRGRAADPRAGQTLIFLLGILVILALVVLWNFDLHKIITVKLRSRNAGDAAALAAARWQGVSLNLIGHLNVVQAVAISDALTRGEDPTDAVEALADLRARLAFVGPMTAFAASQQAAKQNGLYANSAFTQTVNRHARLVRETYPVSYRAPWDASPGASAWDDYADMIGAVAAEGIAAAPDNMRRYTDYTDSRHLLLNPSFYDAIASLDWCWFFYNARARLESYSDWTEWEPLPVIHQPEPVNAEYFGLGLRRVGSLASLPGPPAELRREIERAAGRPITQEVMRVSATWSAYSAGSWRSWTDDLPDGFPFASRIRPEVDVVGADAAVRTETASDRVTPGGGRDTISWTAAAKPFGHLDGPVPPNRYGLVLPAFREVRLIPVDASTAPAGGSHPGWGDHIHEHLPVYMAGGPDAVGSVCWYCRQLRTWEDDDFRAAGVEWIARYAHTCRRPTGPGPGRPGGGTRRGH
jgi:hypothetical protein